MLKGKDAVTLWLLLEIVTVFSPSSIVFETVPGFES
jgi:hypothetical protein